MVPDDDKTRMNGQSTTGKKSIGCGPLLFVAVWLVLSAGALCAQGAVPDSSAFSRSFSATRPIELSDDTSHFSYAISGLFTAKAEGIRHGFGIGFTGFFDRFQPFVPSAGLDIIISSLRIEGLPHADFVILSPTLDLTLRRSSGRLRPYASVGLDLHFSYLALDEPAYVSIAGYDSTTQARQIDMGWEITPHLRAGLIIPVGKRQQILLEGKFMSASHAADVNYCDRLTGKDWHGTVNYRIPSVWISVGIIYVPGLVKKYGN